MATPKRRPRDATHRALITDISRTLDNNPGDAPRMPLIDDEQSAARTSCLVLWAFSRLQQSILNHKGIGLLNDTPYLFFCRTNFGDILMPVKIYSDDVEEDYEEE